MPNAIPENLASNLVKFGCKPNGDTIRTATGRFLLWGMDTPTEEAQPDLLRVTTGVVSTVASHSQGVHKIKQDVELSQEGRARRHRTLTPGYVEPVTNAALAVLAFQKSYDAAVVAFFDAEPAMPTSPVVAILDAEARAWINGAEAKELAPILAEVSKGTPSPRQRRLVYAWRSAAYPLRDEFADAVNEAWHTLRRAENPETAESLDARGEAVAWARMVVQAACRAFKEDSGIQPVELFDLVSSQGNGAAVPLFWSDAEAEQLAGMSSAGVAAAA